jgi:hypothetical protein
MTAPDAAASQPGAADDRGAGSRDPATWSADLLLPIQAAIDRGRASGGPAVRETFDHPQRRLNAAEFVSAWNEIRLKAMSTCGTDGTPHAAPVHAEFIDGRLRSTIYENAVRRRDLRHNPRVVFTTWTADGFAAIVHGTAREIPDTLRETRPGASGRPRRTVALEVEVTRIYAMKPRAKD